MNKKKTLLIISLTISWLFILPGNAASNLEFRIPGINGKILEEVTKKLQLKYKSIKTSDKKYLENIYTEAPKEITKTLKLYGYFQAVVKPYRPIYKRNKLVATFMVKPGIPLKITTIDLKILGDGAKDAKITKHLKTFPLKEGETFQVEKYNAAKQFLFDLVDEYGYIAASLPTKKIQIDLEKNTAAITLHFSTGPRYYFGETSFKAPYFSKQFLKRFLPYKKGEYYASRKLHLLQKSLSNSNFFKKVEVKSQTATKKSPKIPIEVILTPRKKRQYTLGAGFGTDTGPRGSLGIEMRRLTRTGHRFNGLLQASQVQNNLELHYLIPGKNPATDLYDFTIAGETLDLDKGKSFNGQLGFGYTTTIRNWRQTIKLSLQYERFRLINQNYQNSILIIPSINLLHGKKDHLTKPNKGHKINLKLQGTSKYILSSASFFQSQIDAKYLYTFPTKTQIILHGILGYTVINKIDKLPLSLQFYTGGTQTIRGFGYNSIGPGRNLYVGSLELRQRIFGDWYFATFFDAGGVNDDLFKKPNQGTGVGIVWRTSIGAFALTYAKAISKPGRPGRIQFSMGPEL